jgi:hypothetical protein
LKIMLQAKTHKTMPGRRTRRRPAEIDQAEIKHLEYALTCPLPPWTIYEDLQIRRADVLSYLEFLTHDLAQGDPERALTEIQRAADRLKTIASLTPIALAAAIRKHPELRTHVQIKRLRQLAAQQMKDFCGRRRAAEEDLDRQLNAAGLRQLTEPRR